MSHIDEVLELFSDMPAGTRDENDEFPENTFNRAVEDALVEMAEQVHPSDEDEDEEEEEKTKETEDKDDGKKDESA